MGFTKRNKSKFRGEEMQKISRQEARSLWNLGFRTRHRLRFKATKMLKMRKQ